MNIKDDTLYILVEGEPNSPEVESFGRLLSSDITTVNYEFIEIGGSSNFNIVAKLIYNKVKNRGNSIHRVIPVLAIADRDYRKYSLNNDISDESLIATNRARIIYWERHEWENFLLDELDVITNFLNQLPNKSSSQKPIKKVTEQITEKFIQDFLLEYFQNQIQTEFIECLRFRFLNSVKSYPKLKEPQNIMGLENLREWYTSQIFEQSKESKNIIEKCSVIFDQVLEEYNWKTWIENPQSLSLEDGKQYFRGKEAFEKLFCHLSETFEIMHLNKNKLKERILRDLEYKQESILVSQINQLLLPYLEKAKEL